MASSSLPGEGAHQFILVTGNEGTGRNNQRPSSGSSSQDAATIAFPPLAFLRMSLTYYMTVQMLNLIYIL